MKKNLNKNNNEYRKNVNKNNERKIKRGKGKNNESRLCVFSTNAAQLKGKLDSFKSELKYSKVGVFTVQETHYKSKGKVQIEGFEIFEAIRKKVKGVTMTTLFSILSEWWFSFSSTQKYPSSTSKS